MCGRYQFIDDQSEVLKKLAEELKQKLPEAKYDQISLYEVFPSQYACVGVYDRKAASYGIAVMHWGFPVNGKMLINARSESIEEKITFRNCSPCVILASGYYEWSRQPRRKYHFTCSDKPLYLAGLCRTEQGQQQFVILTEDAGEPEIHIHDRQPVILSANEARRWCKEKDIRRMRTSSRNDRIMTAV